MKSQWQRYRELELISDPLLQLQQAPSGSAPRSWLQNLWTAIDLALFRNLEARVWQSADPKTGQVRWHLYNPETGKTQHLNSDAEVRHWLEQIFHD
ncbi:MAG: hypothetical protein EDM05_028905 [Leptolyngbya sp. IPPAS B-1204]|nr:MAG: hypothetical protein EDM05_08570 [Leptolyngbya sp. IPPAS B-1204]